MLTDSHIRRISGAISGLPDMSRNKTSISIRIITHNIRYAIKNPSKGEEPWSVRCPLLCNQLVFNSFQPETFICMQEVLHSQLIDVLTALNHASPSDEQWSYIGVGREDGKKDGEYSPILYRTSVWKLENWETCWLSPTPDRPSKGWDAACIRLVTIGNFTHVNTGRKVTMMNTHFDHMGVVSRQESAKTILDKVKSSTQHSDLDAIFLTGDFNSPPADGAYKIMTGPGSNMEDIGLAVPGNLRYGNEMTFTGFCDSDKDLELIDYIFARKGDKITYRTFGVLANRFDTGVYLSDHRAVVADILLAAGDKISLFEH